MSAEVDGKAIGSASKRPIVANGADLGIDSNPPCRWFHGFGAVASCPVATRAFDFAAVKSSTIRNLMKERVEVKYTWLV